MDRTACLEFGSSAYIRRAFDRAYRERVPVSGALDLTYRCNLRCRHCYVGHLVSRSRSQSGELTTAQFVDLLSAAADAGCLFLLLSGGEPLLRDDFVEVYAAARRLGLIVTVFTNASLVRQEHLEVFGDYPPHQVEVSLYGADEDTNRRVTGVPGAFGRTLRGIELMVENGVKVAVKTMVLRENAHDIPGMESLARRLDLRFRVDPVVTARLDGGRGPLRQRLDPEEAVAIELGTETRRADLARFVEFQKSVVEEEPLPADRLYRCGAGMASFHVDPSGCMHPCLMSPGIAYNATIMGFAEAWGAVTAAVDEATCDGEVKCATCPNIMVCGYCPGSFSLEDASPSRPPEYICRLGEGRTRVAGLQRTEVVGVSAG
jgi:MoaA/NifB/PqqE/SkfB family radical SAM enzyme